MKNLLSRLMPIVSKQEDVKVITSSDIQNDMFSELNFVLGKDFAPEQNKLEKYNEDNLEILSKAEKLKKLGFVNTPSAVLSTEVKRNENDMRSEIILNQTEISLTNKYAITYAGYKFVPERIFKDVCERYNLYTANPDLYIKEIPTKNVEEISAFIDRFGVVWQKVMVSMWGWRGNRSEMIMQESDKEIILSREERDTIYGITEVRENAKIEITAPIDHFNLNDVEIKDRKITKKIKVEDPIVSRIVEGGRIIISVWDKEADIPEINNQQLLN